ncbi:MAG TPA: hypothetical protein VKA25_10165 [Gemmatimonadales bacterium]|nr:hypothetical protein [Gemmatimonadales bacterium]
MLLALLCMLQFAASDTLQFRPIPFLPAPDQTPDSARYGSPQVLIRTRQGIAKVWLLRSSDTLFVAAVLPDSSQYWGDDFVLSIDTRGDAGSSPQHDDFQWYFRRTMDSSIVYRGRNGHWEPPKGDPDWRLGAGRSGGGWEVSGHDAVDSWNLLLRLDPIWLVGAEGQLPRLAFRIFDDDPQGWFAWPLPNGVPQASSVEQRPELWVPMR